MSKFCRRLLIGWVSMAALDGMAAAAPPDQAADWPAYNRTLAGDRYSPLAQVTPANVGKLTLRCTYTLPELASFQTGPLVVDGVMYFTTFDRSYAIDAATCAEKWYRIHRSPGAAGLAVNRGFAYLDGRLFRARPKPTLPPWMPRTAMCCGTARSTLRVPAFPSPWRRSRPTVASTWAMRGVTR